MMNKMKTLLASAVLCAGNLQAIYIDWKEDASSGFDFTVSGSGLPYERTETTDKVSLQYYGVENEHVVSPSGIWQAWVTFYGVVIGAPDLSETWGISIGRFANVWSNGVAGLLAGSTSTPYEAASFVDGLREGTYTLGFEAWKPLMTTSFEYADFYNPSTWQWTMNYVAVQPPGSVSVPDTGNTLGLMGIAGVALSVFGLMRARYERQA